MTLRDLLYQAYGSGLGTAMNVSGGPAWIAPDRFTIEAIAQGNPDDRQFRLMLRRLLKERFAVKTHWETRQIDVYALVIDGDGEINFRNTRTGTEVQITKAPDKRSQGRLIAPLSESSPSASPTRVVDVASGK